MEKYLDKAYELLGKWIPFKKDVLLKYYKEGGHHLFEEGDYHYLLFTLPELDENLKEYQGTINSKPRVESIILLVFDDELRVVGDLAAIHTSLNDYLKCPKVLDYLCEDGDWSYLSHYTLNAFYFEDLPYPPNEKGLKENFEGEVLSLTNAYVTRAYRRGHIFTNMMNMLEDFIKGDTILYEVISLDPDVACYGPDKRSEPYIYNYETDEPVRVLNQEIIAKLGFIPLKLEESEPGENDDGTKLQFAVKKTILYDIAA